MGRRLVPRWCRETLLLVRIGKLLDISARRLAAIGEGHVPGIARIALLRRRASERQQSEQQSGARTAQTLAHWNLRFHGRRSSTTVSIPGTVPAGSGSTAAPRA